MCGISGIAFSRHRADNVNQAMLLGVRDALQHRGPDDAGNLTQLRRGASRPDMRYGEKTTSLKSTATRLFVLETPLYCCRQHR